MVREFKLINEKGQEFSLMDIYNYCLLTDPSGLGYSYSSEYEQLGNTFITNIRKVEKGQISGIANFKCYDNYKKLIDYIENSENLRFCYKIPYKEGTCKIYLKDIEIQSITKTEIQRNGVVSETITFDCLSLWYEENTIEYIVEQMEDEMVWDFCWDSIFNDSNSTSIDYKNEGHVEAPIELEIGGAVTNPKIEVYIDGKLYQQVPINTNILEYEKLLYDSRENAFKIIKVKTDGTEENLFDLDIIEFENDNVIRIPKNKACEIRLRADNTITSAKLTILPQYKCV